MVIELKIDRFENDKAILLSDDNDTIIWPRGKLPKDAKEGSLIAFSLNDDQTKAKESKELAKDILNEILDVDDVDDKE